jgi:ABC-type uncharacterized transport system involved in gliding motility auxiliary subunit
MDGYERSDGLWKLTVGIVYVPLLLVALALLVVALLVEWLLNGVWMLLTGSWATDKQTITGEYWQWTVDRLRFLATGAGDWEWTPL